MNEVGAFAKHFKCQCCNNPWNVSDESESTSNQLTCNPCLYDSKGFTGIDPANIDNSVSLKENFYLWSNGEWKKKNPIPAEYPSWNTFIALRDLNLDRLKSILIELNDVNVETLSSDERKIAEFYLSFIDENKINSLGAKPLLQIFDLIQTKVDYEPEFVLAKLHSNYGLFPLFRLYSSPDKKNSLFTLGVLSQSGLGLPDRDYYFDDDKLDKIKEYVKYISDILYLLGQHGLDKYNNKEYCDEISKEILKFETLLANSHLTRTLARDPELTYNKMSIESLEKLIRSKQLTWGKYLTYGVTYNPFNWSKYFESIGKPIDKLGDINVSTIDAINKSIELLANNKPIFKHYLIFHVVNHYAVHISKDFSDLHFNFHETILKGTKEQKPRWKIALQILESSLGEALGQLYVKKYFSNESKTKALKIVELVRESLRERLLEISWMNEKTKVEAIKKMNNFRVKIGYPDKWIDYSSLNISLGKHIENLFESYKFEMKLELNRINAPTDRERWFMTPQTVNAYYHPSLNEIVFPAAILQPPFFDSNADIAIQFGAFGAVIGHEMTHGFDDQGRKYDFEGNMRDWWSEGDGEEYERRAKVMIEQAEQFEVYGVKLKGKLTCGENIADLGGLKLAFRAMKKYLASSKESYPLINGFTQEQRFFLAWSQAWRENSTKERALQLVTIDPHGPNELRCNGPLSNISEFLEAFDIKEGDPMFRSLENRVDIW